MDGEEERTRPPEHVAPAVTSAKDVSIEEPAESNDAEPQVPDGSTQGDDPTPSGPAEPNRNVEIALPAGWNGSGVTSAEPPGSSSSPQSGPTEASRHVQIELPSGWDCSGAEPSDPSGDVSNSPSAPLPRPSAPVPPNSSRGDQGDCERLVPSIIVTVSLGHSRDMFEQAVEAAIQRATQKFHKIAKQEIDLFAFEQRAARRAADYRLRGPNPQ